MSRTEVRDRQAVPTTTKPTIPVCRAKRVRSNRWAYVAGGFLAIVALAALSAPLLPLHSPEIGNFDKVAVGPSLDNPLGTDQLGRDVLARLVFGTRASLQVGLIAVTVGIVVGTTLGLFAGYLRGPLDLLVRGIMDVALAFPALVFLLVLVDLQGPSVDTLAIGLGLVYVPAFTRLARANSLAVSQREFVTAAHLMGARKLRVVRREILPNVAPSLLAYAFVAIAAIMVAEGSLSYIGHGIQPPAPSLGTMIQGGQQLLTTAPHVTLIPAAFLFLLVFSLNVLGDHLRGRSSNRMIVTQ